jgi:hypothetical protein
MSDATKLGLHCLASFIRIFHLVGCRALVLFCCLSLYYSETDLLYMAVLCFLLIPSAYRRILAALLVASDDCHSAAIFTATKKSTMLVIVSHT